MDAQRGAQDMGKVAFTLITDSRNGQGYPQLQQRIGLVKQALDRLPGLTLSGSPVMHYTFPSSPRCEQWRITVTITKAGRATSWNDVYRAVNATGPAPHYRHIR